MLSYIIPFLILILVVVFIHEYGHYYFARKYGVGVTDFSIGFGKELFGWNDKSGTRWKICVIPLGGYVKFFGDRNVYSQADHQEILEKYNEEERENARRFTEHLAHDNVEFFTGACGSSNLATAAIGTTGTTEQQESSPSSSAPTSIYSSQFSDGPQNKEQKWMTIFGEDRYLKCRGDRDIKKVKMYKICRWNDACSNYIDPRINDNGMYIGRIQVNLNNGKKRKFLWMNSACHFLDYLWDFS